MRRERADAVVVGGGASGLAAAAALARRGVAAVVLERDPEVGGTWARRYDRLRLHTVRRFSGLPYHPIPRSHGRYVSKDVFAAYLRDYARLLDLDVRCDDEVRAIRADGERWEVETAASRWSAAAVVVATGQHAEPALPDWPGAEAFEGGLLHSSGYRSGAKYEGRRVLVVGIGNSGAEIAADLVECGASDVQIAVRTSPPIMPRDLFGVLPMQLLGIALTPLRAPRLVDRMGAVVRRVGVGDLRPHGLEPGAWGPFTARRPPVIDVGFLAALKGGRIRVRPPVRALTRAGAAFADGSEDAFDAIIAATGFRTGLERIVCVPGALDERGRPRGRSGSATEFPGLYFAGFDETVRGQLHESRRDAARLAREVRAYLDGSRSPAAQPANIAR